MKLLKMKLNKRCYLLAVVDDADNVISASAFSTEQDIEVATGFTYTLLLNSGLLKAPADLPRPKTVNELIDILKGIYGKFDVYIDDLNQ